LSTWIFFTVAPSLAFGAYLANGGQIASVANIGNMIDPIANLITLVVVWRHGGVWRPTSIEKGSFIAGALILMGWSLTGQHLWANLFLQGIISVGYIPTWESLWRGTRREPAGLWALMGCTAAFAIIPAVVAEKPLAIVYTLRGTILASITFSLILRDRRRRTVRGE
jgi:hypothetical protein